MARRVLLRAGIGEHLLTRKLLILNGLHRRSNAALNMLTGSVAVARLVVPDVPEIDVPAEPVVLALQRTRQFMARTVYLSEHHISRLDRIAEASQMIDARRLSRSAVLRRAVEHLYSSVEADPAKTMLENE